MAPNTHPLRRGWTTGSCATAAAKAAWLMLNGNPAPACVNITLPSGQQVGFAIARTGGTPDAPFAEVIKDAGDDPDITHGALIRATVKTLPAGCGIMFQAGPGVGTVTRPGLPIAVGEPAINPTPRAMIRAALTKANAGICPDAEVIISVENGKKLAERTLNSRLGILNGLSILGTTGIVVPFSCSAWIESIHRGVDVARAEGLTHLAGSTGNVSEKGVQQFYNLPDSALIEMGDFAGGLLKYLRKHPIPRLTISGGIAKMTKLGQGFMDLHSKRGPADMRQLADLVLAHNGKPDIAETIACSPTVAEAFLHASQQGFPLGHLIASSALQTVKNVLHPAPIQADVLVFDRAGNLVGQA
ncbi:cobalt-precorrin-5B (C(1))-methyltransferase [Acetobacter ascendens]|uniref:Cobalt-precorrin-5B C(1)-methyltransferase n=1 Tax=Acetobacter ascendens TaxID=481146 RepID=A0A1D8QVE1_9PROT|nr:cobalt-precorrin-5B (C(1))-methyltransferase [Acetobacter ascendens]AOW46289.1 cobalt-precorrin-5B (C(1))-methyltransferase [Acetobacter ascendens]AOW49699.1 cobalt-precorrin-5B (C(1))-methyltransferase [Acetobacter ascendens]